jgi:FKBP-type peptidyl-prolyl cis-trans isomerase
VLCTFLGKDIERGKKVTSNTRFLLGRVLIYNRVFTSRNACSRTAAKKQLCTQSNMLSSSSSASFVASRSSLSFLVGTSSSKRHQFSSSSSSSSSSSQKKKKSFVGRRGGVITIVSKSGTDGDRVEVSSTTNNKRRHFLTSSALVAFTTALNINGQNNSAFAKFTQNNDDDEEWIVNPKRIKVENEPDGYKPNENWTEAKKEVERPPPEPVRDPKDIFKSNSNANSSSSNSSSSSSDEKQQREQEDEENVIEIDIDLVEPGYVPTSQKEVDEKTLKQAVNNAKIKQFNNAPDDFPTFIREGYDVNVVTPSGYKKTEDGLMYYDFAKGSGKVPGKDQEVTFHYVAYNENGGVIDSTYRKNAPAKARLGIKGMIPGFEEGLSTMKPGGKRRIVVPPELGPPVGPATFFSSKQWEVFDIELIDSKSCSREGGLPGGFGSTIVCN